MKKIIRINASALKYATCFLRFYRICIQGYKSPLNTNTIEFGSAGHLFLSMMAVTNGNLAISLVAARKYFAETKMEIDPKKKYLDDLKLCSVCVAYWSHLQNTDQFKILTNELNEPAVEVTFSNKFYEDENYIILLEGTIDKIGKFDGGAFALGDYKFTTLPYETGVYRQRKMAEYFKQHEMGTQLRFYRYNIELKAKLEPSPLLDEITKRPIGCFIDAIFTSSAEQEFKRSRIFFFPDEDMLEFENMLKAFCSLVITILKQDTLPPRHGVLNGACAGGWRPCNFIDVCNAPDDIAREHVLHNNFIQAEYLPIKERD